MKLKWHADVVNGYAFKSDEFRVEGIPIVRQSNLKLGKIVHDGKCYPNELVPGRFMLKEHDVCIGLSGSVENFGVIKDTDMPCAINQRVGAIRATRGKANHRFIEYLVQSDLFKSHIAKNLPSTTIVNIDASLVRCAPFPTIGVPTQKRIADFLDRETARIDQLIEKKMRLNEVLKEKRSGMISAAVAGKIGPAADPTAAQGTIKHEIRLRFLLHVAPSARENENLNVEDEVTFTPMDAIDDGLGGLDSSMSRPLGEVAAGSYNYFREGDVLLAKVTPCFENGKKAIAHELINGVGFATSEVHVFRPTPGKLDARFLMYLFSSDDFRAGAMKSMTGAGGLKRVSDAAVMNYRPRVVDYDMQREVANFLDNEMRVFEVVKDRTKASIDRLKEYRAALITAATTGRIDVDTYGKVGASTATIDRIEEEMQT